MPPGFSRGITFAPAIEESFSVAGASPPQTVTISELLGGGGVLEWTLGRMEEEGGGEGKGEEGEREEEGKEASVKQVMFLFVAFSMFSF